MDETISTQAFETLHEKAGNVRTSPGAALLELRTRSPLMVRSFVCLCVLLLLGFYKGKRLYPMLSLVCGIPMAYSIRYVPPKWEYNAFEDLDHQGLSHPDLMFVYNNDMVNDLRLFPYTSDGMPTNVMFWGGWERGSQEYEARLAVFGLDGDHFTPADWLKPFMRHVTVLPEPYEPLLTHLREQVDERVDV